jgi:hypothetical protein
MRSRVVERIRPVGGVQSFEKNYETNPTNFFKNKEISFSGGRTRGDGRYLACSGASDGRMCNQPTKQ